MGDWYFQLEESGTGMDALDSGSLLPKTNRAVFDKIADKIAPDWRERRHQARIEADMLWRNQGITHLPVTYRDGLTMLSDGLRALNQQFQ